MVPAGVKRAGGRLAGLVLLAVLLSGAQAFGQARTFCYFGLNRTGRTNLSEDGRYVVVVTKPGTTLGDLQRLATTRAAGLDSRPVLFDPRGNLAVLRANAGVGRARTALNQTLGTPVRAVLRSFTTGNNNNNNNPPIIETDRLCVNLGAGANRQQFLDRYGLALVREMDSLTGQTFLARVLHPEDSAPTELANRIAEDEPNVLFAHVDYLVPRRTLATGRTPRPSRLSVVPAFTPNDPLYAQQWHLENTGQSGGTPTADANLPPAWNTTRGDANTIIAVIDDSCDTDHEDLNVGGKIVDPFDSGNQDFDPRPDDDTQNHGTSVCGVATAAGNNGIGVTGAAPDCKLMPIKLWGTGGLANDASAFDWARTHGASVCNNSWGYTLPGTTPAIVAQAITNLALNGRGGKGTPVLFAAGNDDLGVTIDNGGADTTCPSNYRDVWSIAASDDTDKHSYYSNTGDAVQVCAPSNGGVDGSGITTTDRMGAPGYSPNNYTNDFGGTSSATPLTTGVTALILSLDPQLTRDEALGILTGTAKQIDPAMGAYDSNGHSRFYGHGRIDAGAAIARTLQRMGTQVTLRVQTQGAGTNGIQPTTKDTPVVVHYTSRSTTLTASVWDGHDVTIGCDAGSDVTFDAQDAGSGTVARWVTPTPIRATIGNQPQTLIGTYIHQLKRSFKITLQPGVPDLDAQHPVSLTTISLGQPQTGAVAGTAVPLWADTASTYTFGTQAQNNDASKEQWVAADTTGDGQPDATTGRISLQASLVEALFYHQVRPRIVLNGTNASSKVTTSKRKLLGKDVLQDSLFGIYQDWADDESQLAFSATSTGTPILAAVGQREFTVEPGLDATVSYIVQPQVSHSTLTLSRSTAPANGRTAIRVTVTVNDSADQPVAGIDAGRLNVTVLPTAGVQVTNPSGATDSTGRLFFDVTGAIPGTYTLTATLDGEALGSPAQAQYLQVTTVPLAMAGTYLITFPITPGNSHQTIGDFNVSPQPAQLARLKDDPTKASDASLQPDPGHVFDYYRPDTTNKALDLAPGKGFWLHTTSPGSVELTGTPSSGPSYNLLTSPAGFHQLGNPQFDKPMLWRLGDFEVFRNGVSQGLLSAPSTWQLIDPIVWAYNGTGYEMVADPVLPGTEGLKNQLAVFEGFFWKAQQDNVTVVYTPTGSSARVRRTEPVTPANFGFGLTASVDGAASQVVLGVRRQALRAGTAPALPGGDVIRMELVGTDSSRAAAEWIDRPITQPQTWVLAVTCQQPGRPVTVTWPSLTRQLPAGYRVKLTDPTNGQSLVLNTHSAYTFTSGSGERRLAVTVSPRNQSGIQIVGFEPVASRSRAVGFTATLSGDAEVFLRVTSLGGRLVAETSPVTATGTVGLAWNGTDASGRPVPRGVYQVTLIARTADGETARAVRTVTVH